MKQPLVRFTSKDIKSKQTVSEILTEARANKNVSCEDVAAILQISPFYLETLETGEYGKLPSLVYSRNFVKQYCAWLGLSVRPVLELFEAEWQLFNKLQQSMLTPSKEELKRTHFWKLPKYCRAMGAAVIIFMVCGYLGKELFDLRQPPSLVLEYPNEEAVISKQLIQIAGFSEPEAEILINDQAILTKGDGYFSEQIALQPGLNIIEVKAQKKYSKENILYRKVMVNSKPVITSGEEELLPIS